MLLDRKTSNQVRSSLLALSALLFLGAGCATAPFPAEAPAEPRLASVVEEDYSDDYAEGWTDEPPLIEEEIGAYDPPAPR